MNKVRYRPDIDGLRALSVLAVLFFHLDWAVFKGGFVGVDVFFVISGFLITRLIKDEVSRTNSFSYKNFYIRRARRLFPALYFTLAISVLLSFLLLSAPHFERFGEALAHAVFSLSNFFFWKEAGYFDVESTVKPLLHTWSLSVEEQFYIVWPAVLVWMLKRQTKQNTFIVIIVISVISLMLNDIFSDGEVYVISHYLPFLDVWFNDGESTIFYLAPFRVFEFGIGAILVWLIEKEPKSLVVSEILFFLGLVLIVVPVFKYSSRTVYPSYHALIPCLGAALIIYSGEYSERIVKVLSNKMMVALGLMSYSLYLIHWPLIVFYKYYSFNELSSTEKIGVSLGSIILAALMYKFIELPFRRPAAQISGKTNIKFVVYCILLSVLILIPASIVWANKGLRWRTPTINKLSDIYKVENHIKRSVADEYYKKSNPWSDVWEVGNGGDILIIGDSHAKQYKWMSNYLYERYGLSSTIFISTGCPPIFKTYKVYGAPNNIHREPKIQIACRDQTEIWEQYININASRFRYVILASRWAWLFERGLYHDKRIRSDLLVDKDNPKFNVESSKDVFIKRLGYTIDKIKQLGLTPVIFGQVTNHGKSLAGCDDVPRFLFSEQQIFDDRCRSVPKDAVLKRFSWTNSAIKNVVLEKDGYFMNPTDYLCRNNEDYCLTHYRGVRLSDDDDHVNENGALYIANEWSKSSDFPFVN